MFPNIDLKQLASLVVREIKSLKGNQKLSISDLQNGDEIAFALAKAKNKSSGSDGFDMSDQRWHGGGGTSTFYTNAVSGTIDSANRVFTVPTTISSALALYLANSVYQPGTDFIASGTTITMTVAPDASLSGQPFWLLYT